MKLQAKLIQVLPATEGVSQNGNPWKRQQFIVETMEQYPRKICFDVNGTDRIAGITSVPTDIVEVDFELSSREHQGRYYTQAQAWRIVTVGKYNQ